MSYLYVCEQGAKVCYEGGRFKVKSDDEILKEALAETLESIQIYGNVQITTQCMRECLERGIDVVMYSYTGKYHGRITSPYHIQVARQRVQAAMTDDFKMAIARKLIHAKIKNQIVLLRRYIKNSDDTYENELALMQTLANSALGATSNDELMGYEGAAAKYYFEVLGKLVNPTFAFDKRTKRPPLDPFNAMLGMGYSRIHGELHGKIEAKGLNAYFGILHQDKEHHATLASDLMEEWRPVIIDSTVMSMLNGHELSIDDFQYEDEGAVYMQTEGRKKFMAKLESKFATEQQYLAYIDYPVSFRNALDLQINSLCHAIEEGRPEAYIPVHIR